MELEALVQQVMERAWQEAPVAGWQPRLTPPLPAAWLPDDSSVVWYCYADRFRPDWSDAVEIAAPWGRLVLPAGIMEPAFQRLGSALEALGPQGVRPLRADELMVPSPALSLFELLRGGPMPNLNAIADRLHRWRSLNGRIAAHPAVAAHLPPR